MTMPPAMIAGRGRRGSLATLLATVICVGLGMLASAGGAAAQLAQITEFTTGSSTTDAGAHPDVFTTVGLDYEIWGNRFLPRSIQFDLPPGLMGNPTAVGRCPRSAVGANGGDTAANCPLTSQVGTIEARILTFGSVDPADGFSSHGGVYVVESGPNEPARLVAALAAPSLPSANVAVDVRTESDFGVSALTTDINSNLPLSSFDLELWGVPGAHTRGGYSSEFPELPPDPPGQWKAFLTNPTVCDAPKLTTLGMTFYDAPDTLVEAISDDPTPTNCQDVPFVPSFDLQPTSRRADDATGLAVDVGLPQTTDPTVLGTSHLRRAEVTLPAGTTFNPAAGDGLAGCTDAQLKLHTRLPAECPDASQVGTVEFDVPLLDDPLKGSVYLGTPLSTDPQSGQMFRIFQVARGYGLNVKIAGYAKADPVTGRITAVFGDEDADGQIDPDEGLPQVPFSNVHMEFKGGPRGVLATPSDCGVKATEATFTPWAVPDPVGAPRSRDVSVQSSFVVSRDGAGAPCPPAWAFSPALSAGMLPATGGGHGQFSFTLTREDRTQEIGGLTAELPGGLLASVRGVPLCTNAQASANACPAGSQLGTVSAGSGAGAPLFLPGKVFLTEGYKGAPYGLSVAVPAKAGPFDLGVVVVRQAVQVDPVTAQVKAVSDPLPTIWHGIPLRLRSIGVDIDRSGFMRNPTDCSPKRIQVAVTSTTGTQANVAAPFQARACRNLRFGPRLAMRLTGKRQTRTGRHPGVNALVTQKGLAEAGIERAQVRLPKSLALDPDNAQALCEFADGTKPDLESHCPKGSIVGRARAVSPLLNRPLTGNVYFVKNVRRSASGNLIRTLPMIVVALRGEIAVNLRGESSTTKGGKLVNTFASVPDAPISRFNLNIKGGSNGILTVTRRQNGAGINLCKSKHVTEADFDGHNGKRFDRDIRVKTACKKK